MDLGFSESEPGFQAEGLVWTAEGRILKAVEPRNQAVPLPSSSPARSGAQVEVLVEAASNPHLLEQMSFSPTRLGSPETGDGVLTGPVVLQDHGDRVRYRNVWLEPLTAP